METPQVDAAARDAAAEVAASPPVIVPPATVVIVPPPFDRFAGRAVVVDTESQLIYLGTLIGADEWFIELAEADCHDRHEGHSTNEKYVMEASKFGVKTNRKRVAILRTKIVSISKIEDVIRY